MSRIGKLPIKLPKGVEVSISDDNVLTSININENGDVDFSTQGLISASQIDDQGEEKASVKVDKEIKLIEIDLLGMDGKKYVLSGECKFKSEKFDKEDFDIFQEKLNYLPSANLQVMLFSLSGFTDYVIENSKNLTRVTLEEMY